MGHILTSPWPPADCSCACSEAFHNSLDRSWLTCPTSCIGCPVHPVVFSFPAGVCLPSSQAKPSWTSKRMNIPRDNPEPAGSGVGESMFSSPPFRYGVLEALCALLRNPHRTEPTAATSVTPVTVCLPSSYPSLFLHSCPLGSHPKRTTSIQVLNSLCFGGNQNCDAH